MRVTLRRRARSSAGQSRRLITVRSQVRILAGPLDPRPVLEQLERAGGNLAVQLAYLAVQQVEIEADDLSAARRRALLVLASGGDPRRELDFDSRAVTVLAEDLHSFAREAELAAALVALRREADGLEAVSATLDGLLADATLAWRWACCALLAEEVAGGGA